jgi:phosphoserine phosphatase
MNKAFVFDFDDTLAITSARVIVRNSMNVAYKSISSLEFPGYKLGNGESFDFSEFRDDAFVKNADPKFLMVLAREVYEEGHKVFILTARQDTVAAAIHTWLMYHGVDATEVHCVGAEGCVPVSKKKILMDIVSRFDKTYFYDDSESNISIFKHEKLRSYLV